MSRQIGGAVLALKGFTTRRSPGVARWRICFLSRSDRYRDRRPQSLANPLLVFLAVITLSIRMALLICLPSGATRTRRRTEFELAVSEKKRLAMHTLPQLLPRHF